MAVIGRLPTVPEYYQEHINQNVDLMVTPFQCCPFHQEDTPSFSYNIPTGRWSCFGKCHAHGDVIEMHKRWFHFNSKEEAEEDLRIRYKLPKPSMRERLTSMTKKPLVDEDRVEENALYAQACALARTPERWIELDYVMSKFPVDKHELTELLNKWKGVKSLLDD